MFRSLTISLFILSVFGCRKETIAPLPLPADTTKPASVYTFTDASGNCNTIDVQGSYAPGQPLDSSNYVVLQANVISAGPFNISTAFINGYKFIATGTFTATGVQQVVLYGYGSPIASAVNSFFVPGKNVSCSFTVLVAYTTPSGRADNDNMYFGNPSDASTLLDSANNYLLRKPYYAESYSRDRGTPNWVSWHLFIDDLGTVSRQDDFRADYTLPQGWYHVNENSYIGLGFDRGHNTPSGDRTKTATANSATFLMTNMIPQSPYHNQVVWADMEDSLRRLVYMGYELYIIMGCYGTGGTGSNGFRTTVDGGRVTVPANIWKVAIVIPNGNNDSSRVTLSSRVIAVNIPNTTPLSPDWKNYRVSVDAIEAATGYNLFSLLPDWLQTPLEAAVDKL